MPECEVIVAKLVADKFKNDYKIGLDDKIQGVNDICAFHELRQ